MTDKLKSFGTKKTGYVEGKYGPFNCGHCSHFVSSISGCVNPEVMADSQVSQEKDKLRYAKVTSDACCNDWYPVSA